MKRTYEDNGEVEVVLIEFDLLELCEVGGVGKSTEESVGELKGLEGLIGEVNNCRPPPNDGLTPLA